jgi:glycerol-3-phosphate O-acyltransferase/dihydroxyacetone phosphate acyltransferase
LSPEEAPTPALGAAQTAAPNLRLRSVATPVLIAPKPMSLLRRLVKVVITFALRTFYRRIDAVGLEKIPERGPVLLVANHYNSLVDPLVIQVALHRWVTFAAAEFLFHGALGGALKALGMIPIYRASDHLDPEKNLESFRRCFEKFERGEAIAIFPEGVSHDDPHVLRLKSGAARIVIGAEERHAGALGLTLVPLGLVYEAKERFQGQVTVIVGDPIDTRPWLALAREHPQRAVRQLTAHLQTALETVTFSQETWEDYRAVSQATKFYLGARAEFIPGAPATLPLEQEVEIRSAFREGFLDLRTRDPEALAHLRHLLHGYNYLLRRLGITDRHVRENYSLGRMGRFLLKNLELCAFGWPVAAWGVVNNWLSYRAIQVVAYKMMSPRRDQLSTHKIYPGLLICAVISLLQTAVVTALCVSHGLAWWWGLLYLISLPLTGWYAIAFLEQRRLAFQSTRAWWVLLGRRRLRQTLRMRRERLVEMLSRLIEIYAPAGQPPADSTPSPPG